MKSQKKLIKSSLPVRAVPNEASVYVSRRNICRSNPNETRIYDPGSCDVSLSTSLPSAAVAFVNISIII